RLWALWFGLLAARAVAGAIVAQVIWWQQITTGRVFLLAAGILLIVWVASPRWYRVTVRATRIGVMLVGFCIFWMIPALVTAGFAHQPWDREEFQKPLPAAAAAHPRVVWLLFDEMSYDQVFVHRFSGLELPNLEKLRGESVTFSDVEPDGFFTEDVIPSIFLGEPINRVRATTSGWMVYRTARHARWQRFDGSRTLFADAQRAGWTTGAIGEYNPYCRILPDQLDFCWMGLPPLPDHFSRDKSTLENVTAPLAADWDRFFGHNVARAATPDGPSPLDELGAVRAADALIRDQEIDLCFVHLPLPHPPGHYDRKTGRIGPGGSYIDNLALSDRILGQMLAEIATSPAAGRTTVILSSDHSWRVGLWRDSYGWTKEDELASRHGHFDPQPMLMVRFPGETAAVTIGRPVPLLAIHDLVERMVAGAMGDPQQLEAWAKKQ
ncbi:MAG: sulfatase-like hydrolase/transferase, partial [Acidobacteriaceae bacterium]